MICTKCQKTKEVSEFSPSKKHRNGRFPWCKACKNAYQKKYINGVPKEERQRRAKAWKAKRDSDKEARARYLSKSTIYSLKSRYGITPHQVIELAAYQGEVCAICSTPPDVTRKRGGLHVDHDHTTKQVRGLLREKCNQGLGFFRDDIDLMEAAIKYCTDPPARKVEFTKPLPKPDLSVGERNPAKQEILDLVCKSCGHTFQRKAKDEFAHRSRGKEGPFCSQGCSGTWAQSQQEVRGLVHGTTNGYTYYKCRCSKCKKAHTEAERVRRERKKKNTNVMRGK